MKVPVIKVDVNIKANGSQVPKKLENISKLRLINIATTKKSGSITTAIKIDAVIKGGV